MFCRTYGKAMKIPLALPLNVLKQKPLGGGKRPGSMLLTYKKKKRKHD